MGFASSGQEEAEGWGVLVLGEERWEGGLCLWWWSRRDGRGCACAEEEEVERWGVLGQAEARDGVCLWWTRRHGGMGLLVLNWGMLLTQCCVIIQGDGDLGLKQAIGTRAGPYHVPFVT